MLTTTILALVLLQQTPGPQSYEPSVRRYGMNLPHAVDLYSTLPYIGQQLNYSVRNDGDETIVGLLMYGLAPTVQEFAWGFILIYPVAWVSEDLWQLSPGEARLCKFQVPPSQRLLGLSVYVQALAIGWSGWPASSNGLELTFGM